MRNPKKNRLERKRGIALFTAKHIIGNSDIVHNLAVECRVHFLEETIRQFLWEKVIEELASEYMISKKVPRQRRIAKVIKDEMSFLFEGKYDEEFEIKW